MKISWFNRFNDMHDDHDHPIPHRKEVISMNRIKLTALVLLLAAIGLVLVPKDAHAISASSVGITVTVKISGSLSVSAAPTSYAFGNIGAGVGSISATSITVTNDSDAFTETYNLSAANSTDGTVTWTLSSAQGTDQYVLAAVFSAGRPGSTFVDANRRLTTSSQASSGTVFAGDQTGLSVLKDATRILWFELVTPNSTGSTTTQTTTVTVRASAG